MDYNVFLNAFQVSDSNPLVGAQGRFDLLKRLGGLNQPEFFGSEGRPGYLVDYLLNHDETVKSGDSTIVPFNALWTFIMQGIINVWPAVK